MIIKVLDVQLDVFPSFWEHWKLVKDSPMLSTKIDEEIMDQVSLFSVHEWV